MDTSRNPPTDAAPDNRGRPKGDPHEFIRTFLEIESAYHNHKEQMTYVIATLYLAAAGYVVIADPVSFGSLARSRVFQVVAIGFALAGFAFVLWQLVNRRGAHVNATAAYRLIGRWHLAAPSDAELEPELEDPAYRRYQWPKALVLEIRDARKATRVDDKQLRTAEGLTLGLVGAFGLAAICRIIGMW